jgi:hypothetical protein
VSPVTNTVRRNPLQLAFQDRCIRTDIYRRCRRCVVLAVAVGAVLSPTSSKLLASDDASSGANGATVEQIECSKHGGKVRTLRCAMRPLDTVPGGQWLKLALGVAILVGVP